MSAEDVKNKIDIVDYLISTGVQLKRAGRNFKACCPFHDEKTPSFMVNADRQTWRCFGACAEGGDIISYVMRRDNLEFRPALELLADHAGVELKQFTPRHNNDRLYSVLERAVQGYHAILTQSRHGESALEYLTGRGVNETSIALWGIGLHPGGAAPIRDKMLSLGYTLDELQRAGLLNDQGNDVLSGRLIFPLHNHRGDTVGLAGRDMTCRSPAKYVNTTTTAVFARNETLYGYHVVDPRADLVIVEGYLDVITAHQMGYQNVVASMGTAITAANLKRLRGRDRLYLAFDGDNAGMQAAARNATEAMSAVRDVRICIMPDGQDPDDVIKAGGWDQALSDAIPAADFLIQQAIDGLGPDATPFEKNAVIGRLTPVLSAGGNPVVTDDNLKKLAEALAVSEKAVKESALPPRPKTTPVEPSETLSLEQRLINAMFHRPAIAALTIRLMRQLGLPDMSRSDFPAYPHEFDIMIAAMDQDDMSTVDYANAHGLDPAPVGWTNDEAIRGFVSLRIVNIRELLTSNMVPIDEMRRLNYQVTVLKNWMAKPVIF